ncbi:sulfite exporter TauE/SafE family protein [Baekduia soli]|uniref:Probable membrane transporter protein n=1 Tax=Baekduia soli TaxID=496014 RepID=A0A5B8U9Q9_9ACTN|nr:sulfite exporter TauE/SafE family protein [Baekduia soli]QEC49538.1 sulfite exporter TauE/SafE family protein [Baekduia soli]
MTTAQAILVAAAGVAAGTINTVVGSGTLITFPVLLGVGYPPLVANVSNTVGLVPGSVSGALGYRGELEGQGGRVLRMGAASVAGGIAGALLLLTLPASAFKAIVPVLVGLALVLVVIQPRLAAWLTARQAADHVRPHHGGPLTRAGIFGTGVYGGYFGAAQGILLLAILGLTVEEDLQRANALKNILAGLVNCVSGIVFIVGGHVAWLPAALIAGGSVVGGQIGSRVGRRLSRPVLRGVILVVGIAAIVHLVA